MPADTLVPENDCQAGSRGIVPAIGGQLQIAARDQSVDEVVGAAFWDVKASTDLGKTQASALTGQKFEEIERSVYRRQSLPGDLRRSYGGQGWQSHIPPDFRYAAFKGRMLCLPMCLCQLLFNRVKPFDTLTIGPLKVSLGESCVHWKKAK